jgi:nucleoside-diphosphate-sugar epimerase
MSSMDSLKIVITGGAGFIGSTLCDYLTPNHHVIVFDKRAPKNTKVNFIKGDILDQDQCDSVLSDCDIVIHLAALVGVEKTENNLIDTLDFNIIGTKNILESCVKNSVKKIIFSSSSEAYGEPQKVPINENDPLTPITTYGLSKLVGEEYVKSYSKQTGLNYTIVRFFNVYGPYQSPDFVITRFINLALTNEPILLHNGGNQIRSFCHVFDICEAISKILTGGNCDTFNIGNNSEPISIDDLSKKIILLTNSSSKTKIVSFQETNRNRMEIIKRIPDIQKAQKILNYVPKISLEQGIKSILEVMK